MGWGCRLSSVELNAGELLRYPGVVSLIVISFCHESPEHYIFLQESSTLQCLDKLFFYFLFHCHL